MTRKGFGGESDARGELGGEREGDSLDVGLGDGANQQVDWTGGDSVKSLTPVDGSYAVTHF